MHFQTRDEYNSGWKTQTAIVTICLVFFLIGLFISIIYRCSYSAKAARNQEYYNLAVSQSTTRVEDILENRVETFYVSRPGRAARSSRSRTNNIDNIPDPVPAYTLPDYPPSYLSL